MSFLLRSWLFLKYGCIEAKKRKLHFGLTLLSCILVVTVAAVIRTALDHAPIIFLTLAESESGQRDILMEPAFSGTYLNATQMVMLADVEEQLVPRVHFKDAFAVCPLCANGLREVEAVFLNTEKEKTAEVGRDYSKPPADTGKCYIHEKLAGNLGKAIGDTISVDLNGLNWFLTLYREYNPTAVLDQLSLFAVSTVLEIQDTFSNLEGKFSDSEAQSIVVAEFPTLIDLYILHVYTWPASADRDAFVEFLRAQNPEEFSTETIVNMPKERTSAYMDSNYDNVQKEVTEYASKVLDKMGYFPIDMSLPVLEELRGYRFFSVFLGLILNMILFLLFMLSVILIYSLLMVTVETKTFELGVFRMLGLGKFGMVWLIFMNTMLFVVPSIIIGILLSFGINTYISTMFERSIGVGFDPVPTPGAALYAIALGVLMPILAALSPVMTVLRSQLSESLDISHSKSKAVSITIDSSNGSVKRTLLAFGLISIVFGVSIYIFLPLALLTFNFGLLLTIFFAILICFLLGLVLLVLNVQYLFERLVIFLVFFWETVAMRKLIQKNLSAHRLRNRKTTIMYSLALGFIIFISVSYSIQISSSVYRTLRTHGVPLEVTIDEDEEGSLPYSLETVAERYSDIIDNYAWRTQSLEKTVQTADDVLVKNLGKVYEFDLEVVGLSPSYYDTVFKQFLKEGNVDEDTGLSYSEQLYTARGSQSTLLGSAFETRLALSRDKESKFLIQIFEPDNNFYRVMRPIAFLDSSSGLYFSKYPTSLGSQNVAVSMATFAELAGNWINNYQEIPMAKFLIKLNVEDGDRVDELYQELSREIELIENASIWDYRDIKSSSDDSTQFMNTLFTMVTIVAMFLCFFSLVSTMSANMLEQTKEISVIRALGMKRWRVSLLYVYEAFVLIFVAGLMGIFIGTVVAWTMMAQQIAFTDLPVPFIFPWEITIGVFVSSIVCAFSSSFFPAWKLLRTPIADLNRKH